MELYFNLVPGSKYSLDWPYELGLQKSIYSYGIGW
jgi:hypothetical protein